MPRRAKGPRLYLRRGKLRPGGRLPDVWVVRDGPVEIGTGCGADRLPDAERVLADYIAAKWSPPAGGAGRAASGDPDDVLIAEVLALYAQERAPETADPGSTAGWITTLLKFWGEDAVSSVKRSRCREYVAWRTAQTIGGAKPGTAASERRVSDQTARRELETLNAAIGWWHAEHPLNPRPEVWLPDKAPTQRDALTRDQAAALLKAAMGWRRDPESGRWTRLGGSAIANRRHLRRYLLLGFYTGTRPGLLTRLLWAESPLDPWIDLDAGTVWRRGKAERESRTKRRPLVKVPARLLAHLRRWRAADLRAGELARSRGDEPPCNAVVARAGRPIAGKIRTGFEGIVRDAGLPPEVTPHWMRHSCATWLMEADVDLWEAAGYLGMTAQTLERTYGHHRPDHQAAARYALGGRRR